jgi:hypothetical protein
MACPPQLCLCSEGRFAGACPVLSVSWPEQPDEASAFEVTLAAALGEMQRNSQRLTRVGRAAARSTSKGVTDALRRMTFERYTRGKGQDGDNTQNA